MPLKTRVTELLGIEHPIIQGGMHHVGYAVLAAAVSNAGGLGTVTALTQRTPEDLRREIRECRRLCPRQALRRELHPASLHAPDYGAYARVIVEEKVPVVETAGRNPGEWIKFFKSHGVVVVHKCVAIKHALTAERLGADCISMDGFECAGHPGEDDVGSLVLLAKASKSCACPSSHPAASGTSAPPPRASPSARTGQHGTRVSWPRKRRPFTRVSRRRSCAGTSGAALVMKSVGNTERVYKNDVAREVQRIEAERPGEIGAIRHLVSGENYRKSFQETGDPTTSVWSAGVVMGLIDDVPSCRELVEGMVRAEAVIAAAPLHVARRPEKQTLSETKRTTIRPQLVRDTAREREDGGMDDDLAGPSRDRRASRRRDNILLHRVLYVPTIDVFGTGETRWSTACVDSVVCIFSLAQPRARR